MKKYTAPSYDAKPNPPARPDLPDECEIRGCNSLIVGRSLRKCGKADVFVEDELGQKRGICCYHYATIIDAAGKGRLSCIQDEQGETTLESVRAHWQRLEFDPMWEARQVHPVDDHAETGRRKRGMAHIAAIAAKLHLDARKAPDPPQAFIADLPAPAESRSIPDWSDRPW